MQVYDRAGVWKWCANWVEAGAMKMTGYLGMRSGKN